MKAWVASCVGVALLVVACGGRPPPNMANIAKQEAGTGWQCFTVKDSNFVLCDRVKSACDNVAQESNESPCASQNSPAYCFTYTSQPRNSDLVSCYGNEMSCDFFAKKFADKGHTNISACTEVR